MKPNMENLPSIETMHEFFRLDASTGKLYWRKWSGKGKAGKEAGSHAHDGYVLVSL